MGVLFISHSSRDNATAIRICNWLKASGWGDIFLDVDPEQGLAPGHRWQQELKEAGERCSGVIVLISPRWLVSEWCRTEFLVADQLGKKIFPVLVAATETNGLVRDVFSRFQFADMSTHEREIDGLERLALGLKRAGLSPNSFHWPPAGDPHRPIYRGLEALEEEDAAIFFGRDALITKALDTLRRMRGGAPERMLVILGASGTGKSSFLRAGVVARLRRDEENFVVLPVVRPARAALSGPQGLAASLGCEAAEFKRETFVQCVVQLRERATVRMRRLSQSDGGETLRPPAIVIAVDQAEEFFTAENSEAPLVLDLLQDILQQDRNAIVLVTIRPDSFAKLQDRLAEIPLQPFSLPPIPIGAFKEVIECPARLAQPPIAIEPALVDRLLEDLAAEDALPLLALTLERLYARHRGGGTLTLSEYIDHLGGLRGAIVAAVEAAFHEAQRDAAMPQTHGELEKLARAAFIPALVNLDDADAEPTRRAERLSSLPEATRPLVHHLINQRLLVTNRSVVDSVETDTVEVAHEAILRQWPALKAWIAEERESLRALESVRTAAAEWQRHRGGGAPAEGQSWLTHRGGRLQEAEALLSRPDFASAFDGGARAYLAACRQSENTEMQREKHALQRTRRLQRNIGGLMAVAATVILLAGIGMAQLFAGIAAGYVDVLSAQAAKAATEGNYELSARYALAGLAAADWAHSSVQGNEIESALRSAISASSAVAVLRGHKDQVLFASFSRDGKHIVTASRDGTARIWDAAAGRSVAVLGSDQRAVLSAAFNNTGDRVVTSSENGSRVWNAGTAQQVLSIKDPGGKMYSSVFSPDGATILTASSDETARLWDSASGAPLGVYRGHEGPVETASFSPDGKRAVTGSDDKTARIWDVTSGREIAVLHQDSTIEDTAFSPDGQSIATALDDSTIRLWDANTAQPIRIFRGHEGAVLSVAFSPDGSRIVSGSVDQTVRIWDVRSEAALSVRNVQSEVNSVAFSPDGRNVISASDDGTARVWEARPHIMVMHGHQDAINGIAFSPDGSRLATASSDRTVRVWDARTGNQISVLRGHTKIVEAVAFSPDGTRIISGSDDRTVRVWDTDSGRLLAIFSAGNGALYGVSMSPDGRYIAAASTDRAARLLDARSGKILAELRHGETVNSVEFSNDGQRLLTSSRDGTARIWDVRSAQSLRVLSNGSRILIASFNRDGNEVVTGAQDGTARIWDAKTGRLIRVLSGHNDWIMGAAFTPDSKRIVTASHDKTVRVWDAATGSQIAILRGHAGAIEAASVSADGRWVATGSEDTTARLWNITRIFPSSRADLVRFACNKVLVRGLSTFSASERIPPLDPKLDVDACRPASAWSRLERIFTAGEF